MPSQTRRLSSRQRSAARRIQKTFRRKHAIKRGNTPKSIRQNTEYETTECAICHEPLTTNVRVLKCGHKFHTQCVETLLRYGHNRCPFCRAVISNAIPVSIPTIIYNQRPINRPRANAINNRLVATRVYDNTRRYISDYYRTNTHRTNEDLESSPTFIRLLVADIRARQALARAEETVARIEQEQARAE